MLGIFKSKSFRRSAFALLAIVIMTSLYSTSLVFAASSGFSSSTRYDAQVAASQIKLHDVDVSFDDTRPEPHVCRFLIEGTGYTVGAKGTWLLSGPTLGGVARTDNWGPADADGNWHTEVISGLANGRYQLDVVNSAGGTTTKFFWVDCAVPGSAVANISANAACPQGAAIIKDHTVINMVTTEGKAFVEFTLAPNCFDVTLSLVSYKAPSANFSRETASQQVLFASTTNAYSADAGKQRIEVAVPSCFWQINFVFGQPIVNLGPAASSNFYQDQGRLIAGSEGGFTACTASVVPPTSTTPISQPIPPVAGVPSTGGSASGGVLSWTLVLAMTIGTLGIAALGFIKMNRRARG